MSALKAMLAKQQAKKLAVANPAGVVEAQPNAATRVPSESPREATATEGRKESSGTPAPTPAAAPKGLKFLAKKPATPQAAPAPQSTAAPKDSYSDLDDLLNDESEATESLITDTGERFSDEIACTAPDRELPADLSEQQLAFVSSIDSIYSIVNDPELFGGVVRSIMQELQECPDYMGLMADEDVHTMIKGLRASMGLARIKKAEKKTRAPAKAKAGTQMVSTLDEMFSADEF